MVLFFVQTLAIYIPSYLLSHMHGLQENIHSTVNLEP